MGISAPGIGSNLDVNSIVTALVNAQKGPINQVIAKRSAVQAKISALGSINSALAAFQKSVSNLSTVDKFMAQTVTSSDSTSFSATSNGKAVSANYAIKVVQLAQSQKLTTASGQASTNTPVGEGTIDISFGEYDSVGNTFTPNATKTGLSITVDPTNNTLTGIRDAINAKKAGVTATIVNDGTVNNIVLTSDATGAQSSLKISVTDTDGNNTDGAGLSMFAFDPTAGAGAGKNMSVLQAAKNSIMELDGISITKQSNSVSDAVEGITFSLLKTTATAGTLAVTRDVAKIEESVKEYVTAYNDLNKVIRQVSEYKGEGAKQSPLIGDATVRSIVTGIKNVMTKTAAGLPNSGMVDIGVMFQKDGTLAADSAKLSAAIAADASKVAAVFSAQAQTTNPLVSVGRFSSLTQAGTYAVNVTQAATQGGLNGSAMANLNIVAGVNDDVNLNVDGVNYAIKLSAGSYGTSAALAAELQSKLSSAGARATVSENAGILSLKSDNYGLSTTISVTGGNGATDLFGAGASSYSGTDVQGTINGVAATSSGQSLLAAVGDPSEGLIVNVPGNTTGALGDVSFTAGYAYQLSVLTKSYIDTEGLVTSRTKSLNSQVKSLNDREGDLKTRLSVTEQRLFLQYSKLDSLLAGMNNTNSALQQQLASLPGFGN